MCRAGSYVGPTLAHHQCTIHGIYLTSDSDSDSNRDSDSNSDSDSSACVYILDKPDKAHAHEAVPMIYSKIIFQPIIKATNSPTVT